MFSDVIMALQFILLAKIFTVDVNTEVLYRKRSIVGGNFPSHFLFAVVLYCDEPHLSNWTCTDLSVNCSQGLLPQKYAVPSCGCVNFTHKQT